MARSLLIRISVFILALLDLIPSVYAQDKSVNHIYGNVSEYKAFLEQTRNANTNVLTKKIRQQYSDIITEKNEALIKQLNDKGFLFDSLAYPFLNSIFLRVLATNSLDEHQFHFFVDRSSEVNAYSYEDGTIACNLGLVTIMENESQIAMVFCHELGHYLLNHVNGAIVKQLEKYNSPEFLAKVRALKKQEYNSKTQLQNLLVDDVFDRRKHSRSQERAADSLGMALFKKTGYNCNTVSRVFDLLDSAESKTQVCTIGDFFKHEKISVEEEWLEPPKKISFGRVLKKEILDSLKTHPDCAQRKIVMQTYFDKYPKPGADYLVGTFQTLSDVKRTAILDEAAYSKEKNNLSFYFYQLIQINTILPSNRYVKTEIFNTLLLFYKHYKSHTLYTVVSNQYIPENQNDEYAKLLKLLDSIDLTTMSQIITAYYRNNNSQIIASSEAINNLNKLNN